jgi:adenylylsulfate kinase-like enzyme
VAAAAIRGVLLTGTIGAGKTTIAEAISERLHEEGERHALLDIDWLGQVYPPQVEADPFNDSLAVRNLAAIWPNFVEAGIRFAVVAATVLNEDQLEGVARAMPGCELTVVRVAARPETVAARIQVRDHGRLLEDFLRRTDSVAEEIERAALESFSVTNEDRPPPELADDILQRLKWL